MSVSTAAQYSVSCCNCGRDNSDNRPMNHGRALCDLDTHPALVTHTLKSAGSCYRNR